MRTIVRLVTRWFYRHALKPVLFRHKPDAVHHGLVRAAKRVQRTPLVRGLPRLWAYQHDMLHTNVAGIDFHNPIGLSAGFDKTIEMPMLMKAVGFGWMTGGSVTWGKYKGNDGAWFYRLPKTKSLVVNAGLPSEGAEVVSGRVAGYNPALFRDFPLNVSVAKTNTRETVSENDAVQDYCASLARFDTLEQVSLLEVNISCPNTFGGEPFTTPERLEKLLRATDKLNLTNPVIIKMPINLPLKEFDALLQVIVKHKVVGIATGNLLKDRTKATIHDELPDHVKGNLSGVPTKEISNELIRFCYTKYSKKLVIIGIGGVMSAEDAYEKIRAGASLVALITGMIYEGPQLVGEINAGLVKLLERDGLANVAEAVGLDAGGVKPK